MKIIKDSFLLCLRLYTNWIFDSYARPLWGSKMKKLLLCTALSFVFIAPSFAEDPRTAGASAPVFGADGFAAQAAVLEPASGDDVHDGTGEEVGEVVAEGVHEASEKAADDVVHEEKADKIVDDVMHEAKGVGEDVHAKSSAKPHAYWGYTGAGAAPYWGNLDAAYSACKDGAKQSPVNISKFLQEDLAPLEEAYSPSPLHVVNNGHTIQVNFKEGSGFTVAGVKYNLLQAHFHTPSEHYLDGAPYPMEVHFVHKANDGTLGVVGVMMKVGVHNPAVEGIWQNAPIQAGQEKIVDSVEINAADLLPASLDYYKYEGSLTTPPCSEGVQWHVLKLPIAISEKQLKAFQALFPVNARPVQSLNGRVVTGD